MLARICAQVLLLLILTCGLSFADEAKIADLERSAAIINLVQGKYALVQFMDAEPEESLDKEAYMGALERIQQELSVQVIQMAIYDKGKRPGEGVRAVAELIRGQEEPTLAFTEPIGERTSRSFEKYMTYTVLPDELFYAFYRNREDAEKLYKDRPLIIDMPYTQGIERDEQDRPILHIQGTGSDIVDIIILLDPDDPFISNVMSGGSVIVRGFVRGYERPSVFMQAEIIMVDGETRPY